MPKYLIWIAGLRGPEPQLCYNEPVDGAGLAKYILEDDDKRSFRELIVAYPAPGEAPCQLIDIGKLYPRIGSVSNDNEAKS